MYRYSLEEEINCLIIKYYLGLIYSPTHKIEYNYVSERSKFVAVLQLIQITDY